MFHGASLFFFIAECMAFIPVFTLAETILRRHLGHWRRRMAGKRPRFCFTYCFVAAAAAILLLQNSRLVRASASREDLTKSKTVVSGPRIACTWGLLYGWTYTSSPVWLSLLCLALCVVCPRGELGGGGNASAVQLYPAESVSLRCRGPVW